MSKEEIEQLAQSLKNSGLAASMEDAIKKAEAMLNKKNKGQGIKVDKKEKPLKKKEEKLEPLHIEEAEELFINREAEEDIKKKQSQQDDLTKFFDE